MEIAFTECVAVSDASSVGEVRRAAQTAAHRLGLDETQSGELTLLASEASRNVLIHGGGGQVVLTGMTQRSQPMARILAMDKGSGIANIALAMGDGYSTAGTMGGGLGAMKRMATKLEIFTGQSGTIVLIELGIDSGMEMLEIAGMAVALQGESTCGDNWCSLHTPERTITLIVDGLGHGYGAAEAAQEAVATFYQRSGSAPAEMLNYVHSALRKTRGAVAAVAEIRPKENLLTYAGVGNISAVLLSGGNSKSLVSYNGTLGITITKIQEFRCDWPSDAVLVLHSDGLQSRWDLSSYPGLLSRHPAVIGGALLRDFRRQRDDASVVVIKAA